MEFVPTEKDLLFVEWLKINNREGYVEAFLSLQKSAPRVLQGLSEVDWMDIFLKFPPASAKDAAMDLAELFSAFTI